MTIGGHVRRHALIRRILMAAAAVAATLLVAAGGGSPASAAPRAGAAMSGYLYWSNATASDPGKGTIGRARLNGTDVNQKFIKTAQPNGPDDVVADSGHLYWANDFNIGRANLNGTDVNQKFIKVPGADILLGVAVDPGQRGRARNHSSLSTGSGPTLARTGGGPATGA
jgi:hypothetical protein